MKQSSPYGPPQPAPGGVVGWFNDKIRGIKNRNNRTAAGAYEQSGSGPGRSNRGFGPLDPDEAWDSRVGHEADAYAGPGGYYEEQEIGLTPRNPGGAPYSGAAYNGSSYQMNLPTEPGESAPRYEEERGRTRSRSPGLTANPFADSAEPSNMSLRGVSPRPMDAQTGKKDDVQAKRSSMFREDV